MSATLPAERKPQRHNGGVLAVTAGHAGHGLRRRFMSWQCADACSSGRAFIVRAGISPAMSLVVSFFGLFVQSRGPGTVIIPACPHLLC